MKTQKELMCDRIWSLISKHLIALYEDEELMALLSKEQVESIAEGTVSPEEVNNWLLDILHK
jgi:hypothetical protein